MPGGDRTGPAGLGPMTGRAAGYCAGYGMPGYANPAGGRAYGGFGRGFGGGGRGRRNRYWATGVPGWAWFGGAYSGAVPGYYGATAGVGVPNELDVLKGQADYFENALDGIKKRIAELEKQANESKE